MRLQWTFRWARTSWSANRTWENTERFAGQPGFKTLWGTARHRHESDDIEIACAVIHRLRPAFLLAHDASPPPRLPLQPRAILATCAVHAGEMPARWEECCRHPALPFRH